MSQISKLFALWVLTATAIVFGNRTAAGQQNTNTPQTQVKPASKDPKSTLPDGPAPSTPPTTPQPPQADQVHSSVSTSALESSSSAPLKYWTNPDAKAQMTVKEDTLIRVMTDQPLSTRQTKAGTTVHFTLSEDVAVDGTLIIPKGATVYGTIVESKMAGTLTGSPDLVLQLTSLDFIGHSYPLYTYQLKVVGASKTKPTETKVKGGAVIGALVGGAFSGSAKGETTAVGKLAGMGTGAALGAGVGAMTSAATPGPILSIPAESQMDFYLSSPISVVPPTEKQALQLSKGMTRGGPVLYVRGETP
jgi:hypothetical protein